MEVCEIKKLVRKTDTSQIHREHTVNEHMLVQLYQCIIFSCILFPFAMSAVQIGTAQICRMMLLLLKYTDFVSHSEEIQL